MNFNFFTTQYAASKLGDRLEVCFGTRGETRRGKQYFGKGRNIPFIPLITNIILSNRSLLLLVYCVPSWLCLCFSSLVRGVPLLRQGRSDLHNVWWAREVWLWEKAYSRLKRRLKLLNMEDYNIFKYFLHLLSEVQLICAIKTLELYLNSHFWLDGYVCWNFYKITLCGCHCGERHSVSVTTVSVWGSPGSWNSMTWNSHRITEANHVKWYSPPRPSYPLVYSNIRVSLCCNNLPFPTREWTLFAMRTYF